MNGSPFGNAANTALPGGAGDYLTCGPDERAARHVVMIAAMRYRPAGFKSKAGTIIQEYQVLKTDAPENHAVGATKSRVYNLDNNLSLGNFVTDLCAYRSHILGKAITQQSYTQAEWDRFCQVATGMLPLTVENDKELFEAVGAAGYRGQVLTSVCLNRPTQKGNPFTVCSFSTPTPQDFEGLEHLFAPAEATG